MLILISVNVQCLQNVVFSFQKGSNSQDHSSSDSHNPIKKLLYSKIFNCPHLREFPPTPEYYLVKTWVSHLHHKTIFGNKKAKVKITFVYLLCTIMLKKSLQQIMIHKFEQFWGKLDPNLSYAQKVFFGVARSLIYP